MRAILDVCELVALCGASSASNPRYERVAAVVSSVAKCFIQVSAEAYCAFGVMVAGFLCNVFP